MKDENNPNAPAALKAKIADHIKELAQETDKARITETMQNYLNFFANFYNYSLFNQFLIMLHRPDSTRVAGYTDWVKRHRYVKKGEKGIPILAPCPKIIKDDEGNVIGKQVNYFKTVYVFDITQTDGEPVPPAPEWKSQEKRPDLEKALTQYAESLGIKVIVEDLSAIGAQGMSSGKKITLDPAAGTKTLIHEITHEMLHQNRKAITQSRQEVELEAEAVAYVVARALGMDNLKSPNYLAIWEADSEKIMDRFDIIHKTSQHILTALQL
jgi:hypothetical protein